MDIATWLHSLGLSEYEEAFRENAIELELLPRLTADDLREIGVIPVGHRRRLLDAIGALRASDSPARDDAQDTRVQSKSPIDQIGERRQVTVVFADLAGYTAWGRQLDAEELHALLEQFFDKTDQIIQEHGGRIDKHIGDCVMGVFGAPIAHGDDAERAARAALAISAAIPDVVARVGRPIGIHIGVAGGQVVASRTGSASHSEYTVTGDTVNLASRLTSASEEDEILVSDDTYRTLAERFYCADAGALDIKGFAEPVRAWRLLGLRPFARPQRPFVGRHGELRLSEAALAACRETGRGQAIFIRGEAGIGKSRLIEEVQRKATEAGFVCHAAFVLDFGSGVGRDAIRSLARNLLGLEVTSNDEAVRTAAAEALSSGVIASDDAVFLNDLLNMPQPPELRPIYEAMDTGARSRGQLDVIARILDRKSHQYPRLIVVEDLHWADQPVLTQLARLTVVVTQHPTVLVMTSRIEGDPLNETWRAQVSGASLTTIDLGPLPSDDARALAETLIANTAFAERCVERAAGNPLFLDQLIRHADESHTVVVAVPGSIQSLVQERIDRLSGAGPHKSRVRHEGRRTETSQAGTRGAALRRYGDLRILVGPFRRRGDRAR